ncbi:MAG: DUF2779 domain-containing protein [Sphingobacteriaceae bacterium]|nr:DUF2779 domain-containing protein [Sphingobacteriaceae bacterium]
MGIVGKIQSKIPIFFQFPLLTKEKLFELFYSNIKRIEDIPANLLNQEQIQIIQKSFIEKDTIIKKNEVESFCERIEKPVAAIDLEIWTPAIPVLNNTKPFQQIPFLFCLFDGKNKLEYFTEHQQDERKSFAIELIKKTEAYQSLLVYDKSMEEQCIHQLALLFPDLKAELKMVGEKLIDISNLFKKLAIYNYQFQNSFTLKSIASVLTPQIEFKGIKSGLEAMNYFENLRASSNPIEKEILKQDILSYCETDVEAVLALYEHIQSLPNKKPQQ